MRTIKLFSVFAITIAFGFCGCTSSTTPATVTTTPIFTALISNPVANFGNPDFVASNITAIITTPTILGVVVNKLTIMAVNSTTNQTFTIVLYNPHTGTFVVNQTANIADYTAISYDNGTSLYKPEEFNTPNPGGYNHFYY
jgi:hypothetical protein